jgi:hypothetical protein
VSGSYCVVPVSGKISTSAGRREPAAGFLKYDVSVDAG